MSFGLMITTSAALLTPHARLRIGPVPVMMAGPPSPSSEPIPAELADLSGALLNVEERVTVSYSGSAASRERRVRRTKRPSKEERFNLSPEPAGYKRMSAFCTADSINLEEAISTLTNERFVTDRPLARRLAITSYTDVVHCRFFSQPNPDAQANATEIIRDAFLFPCARTHHASRTTQVAPRAHAPQACGTRTATIC